MIDLKPGCKEIIAKSRRAKMNSGLRRLYVNTTNRLARRLCVKSMAQTMTEYALILAAVAIAAYITYQVMGQDIGSMVNTIDNAMTTS